MSGRTEGEQVTAHRGTLLLTRAEVHRLLTLDECIAAVDAAFREHGLGALCAPGVLGMHAAGGGFHIKAALLGGQRSFFAAKMNGNFFSNRERFAMPNIQGLILLADAANGYPLAVMDSIEITILRTGAATAVAARHLARRDSSIAAICGCGNQGRIQLRALSRVFSLKRVYAFDADPARARDFAVELGQELGIPISPTDDLAAAVPESHVCVTCTPARQFLIEKEWVSPGTFVAGVGADNEEKQELDPRLLASSKVVADIGEQCARIGDLHHAIAAGLMRAQDIHAELGEVVAGRKAGRTTDEETTVFDSTGTALQDVAAAAAVYERAVEQGTGMWIDFQAAEPESAAPILL